MINDLLGAVILLAYYILFAALLPLILKVNLGLPTELVRKMHHVIYSMSIFLLLELFSTWYIAITAASLLVVLGYPFLYFLEKTAWYRRTFVDRTEKGGELRKQLIYVQLSFALLIFLFWGLFGIDWRYVVAVAIMAWGLGDAAAALIGRTFGRHRVIHYLVDLGKTYEGTAAMIGFAALAIFITLIAYGGQSWYVSLLIALVVAPICGITELFSRRGSDTLTVPLLAACSIMPLIYFFYWLGW
ncbi:MAG: diacylglycerol/polyprenol kinase family protein [Bacillota bacterium]